MSMDKLCATLINFTFDYNVVTIIMLLFYISIVSRINKTSGPFLRPDEYTVDSVVLAFVRVRTAPKSPKIGGSETVTSIKKSLDKRKENRVYKTYCSPPYTCSSSYGNGPSFTEVTLNTSPPFLLKPCPCGWVSFLSFFCVPRRDVRWLSLAVLGWVEPPRSIKRFNLILY